MPEADPPPEGAAEKQPESKKWYAKPVTWLTLALAGIAGFAALLEHTQKILDFFGVKLGGEKGQIVLGTDFPMPLALNDRAQMFLTITKKSRAPVSHCRLEAWMGGAQATVKKPTERFSMGSGEFTQHMTVEVAYPSLIVAKGLAVQLTVVCDDGVSSDPLFIDAWPK
jgi:hypothetical protein